MMTIYLKEQPNGERVEVTYEQHMLDGFNHRYKGIVSHKDVVIYKTQRSTYGGKTLHYGGRNQGGSHLVWNGC